MNFLKHIVNRIWSTSIGMSKTNKKKKKKPKSSCIDAKQLKQMSIIGAKYEELYYLFT